MRAFPALESENANPTAGCAKDKNIQLTINNDKWNAPALGPKYIINNKTINY